ncbi:MAG: terminase small subunit, partial [Candidatus Saccharibacteria bacterium]|nr:terminase small subunit [Rhodoferax sp.]
RMLKKAKVIAEIEMRRAARSERLQIDGDAVVTEAYLIATADMRELVEYRYLCCRCCYGKDFRYQRTQGERKSAFDKHEALQDDREAKAQLAGKSYTRKVFDEKGGTGFDATKEPRADCQECIGHGVGTVVIKDTKTFSRAAMALYAGVKQTKDGLEVKAHSKLDAIEKVMRHLGLYEVDNRQQNDAARIPTEVLDALYAKAMAAAAESKRQMIERSKRLLADEARER